MSEIGSPRDVIHLWAARLQGDPALASRVGGIVRVVLDQGRGPVWVLTPNGLFDTDTYQGAVDCTLTLSSEDLLRLGKNELNPQSAWLAKRLVVVGDTELAIRFGEVIEG